MNPAPPVIRMFFISLLGSNLVVPMSVNVSSSWLDRNDAERAFHLGLSGGVNLEPLMLGLFIVESIIGILNKILGQAR